MPVNRIPNSRWICGAEDQVTYTQAYCKQQMILEDEEEETGKVRYDPETNLEFWGLAYDSEGLIWQNAGIFSLASAYSGLVPAAAALAFTVSLSIVI